MSTYRFTCSLVVLAAALLSAPAASQADSVAIDTSPDPVEDVTYQVTLSGLAPTNGALFATIKATGGRPCGANYRADEGGETLLSGRSVSAQFSLSINETTFAAGGYLLCAWVQDNFTDGTVAAAERVIAIRQPNASGSVTVPARVAAGRTMQVGVTVQTEVTRDVYAVINLPGLPCGANYAADKWITAALNGRSSTGGPFTYTENVTAGTAPGLYTVCGYVQEDSSDAVPEATFNGTFTVISRRCTTAKKNQRRYGRRVTNLKGKVRSAPTRSAKRRRKAELRTAKRKLVTAKRQIAQYCG